MSVCEIITELNKLGGKHGIGIADIVENRVVGMKSRGVYETPGGTILMAAHEQLEELILDRDTMETKKKLGSQFAQIVYEGKWFGRRIPQFGCGFEPSDAGPGRADSVYWRRKWGLSQSRPTIR